MIISEKETSLVLKYSELNILNYYIISAWMLGWVHPVAGQEMWGIFKSMQAGINCITKQKEIRFFITPIDTKYIYRRISLTNNTRVLSCKSREIRILEHNRT